MRAFVALELPPGARAAAAGALMALRSAAPSADVRWANPEGFHVTLQFLGSLDDDRVAGVRDALATAVRSTEPFSCATGALGGFPAPHRARVVWLGISTGAADVGRLAAAVGVGLAPLGFPPEARAFHAHVTLGRVRSPRGCAPLARALTELDAGPSVTWVAREIILLQSHTRPTGAVYTPLARLPLGART